MSTFLLVLAVATLLVTLYFAVQVVGGFVRMTSLQNTNRQRTEVYLGSL